MRVEGLRKVGVGRVSSAGEDGSGEWKAEMSEDGLYGLGFGEHSDEIEAAVAVRAFQGINVVDSFEKRRPF